MPPSQSPASALVAPLVGRAGTAAGAAVLRVMGQIDAHAAADGRRAGAGAGVALHAAADLLQYRTAQEGGKENHPFFIGVNIHIC